MTKADTQTMPAEQLSQVLGDWESVTDSSAHHPEQGVWLDAADVC